MYGLHSYFDLHKRTNKRTNEQTAAFKSQVKRDNQMNSLKKNNNKQQQKEWMT
jgi:hypothetical protein